MTLTWNAGMGVSARKDVWDYWMRKEGTNDLCRLYYKTNRVLQLNNIRYRYDESN